VGKNPSCVSKKKKEKDMHRRECAKLSYKSVQLERVE